MNLAELFTDDKPVQAKKLFSTTEGNVNSLRILAGNQLKEHITIEEQQSLSRYAPYY